MLTLLARLLRQPHGKHVAILLAAVVAFVIGGGAAFAATSHVALTTGLYWAVTTATTVGYGDVTPHNPSSRLIAVLVMVTTIPMLGAAFALFTGSITITRIGRLLRMEGARMVGPGFTLVLGMHAATPQLLEELARAKADVVLVADVDPERLPHRVKLVRGDPTDAHFVKEAEPEKAEHALIAADSDGDALVMAVMLRELAPQLPVFALATSPPVVNAMKDLGVRQVVSGERLVSHVLAKSLESPHAGDLLLTLINTERHRLLEEPVDSASRGKALSQVRGQRSELLLGAVCQGRITLGIGEDPTLQDGDTLLFVVVHEASPAEHGS